MIVNAALFLAVALWINRLAFFLAGSTAGADRIQFYKTFYGLVSHRAGRRARIAPVGAHRGNGRNSCLPVLLTGLVITWCGGFDVIYALQDVEFDRSHSLHSIPARFGVRGGILISILLHLISVYAVVVAGLYYGGRHAVLDRRGTVRRIADLPTPAGVSRRTSPGSVWHSERRTALHSVCYAAFTIADLCF